MAAADNRHGGFHGPPCWAATAVAGLLIGLTLTKILPPTIGATGPVVPFWLVGPFALLLGSIALMPFINGRFWHHHFPDFAFLLGGVVAGYYLLAYWVPDGKGHTYGPYHLSHALLEYYAFIALVGGLYVVSGTILVDVRGRGGAGINTALLAFGAVLSNLVGTTGASMLLIRPFMRINTGRLTPLHVVFFIFIVSNCGGSLTPIGDPPLYMGYLRGVPFLWPLKHLWIDWLLVIGLLLAAFAVYDRGAAKRNGQTFAPLATTAEAGHLASQERAAPFGIRIRGLAGLVCLALMIFGVFIDLLLKNVTGITGIPVGATFQIAVAAAAYWLAPRDILAANDFNFMPLKEVGLLFLGIFITMMPALSYLGANASSFGLTTPGRYYFGTGFLSGFLDNAPTYLTFLQVAYGPAPINAQTTREFLSTDLGLDILRAISTGAVFFGAMTYIGNGPNFMVKAIAEASAVRMPSFFGYFGLACLILLPILVLRWLLCQ